MTRDFGGQILVEESRGNLTEAETAMRVLDDSADLETRYGGGFVQSVNGLSGGTPDGRNFDWFFSVNGIVAERGAAELPVRAGDQVWWDYHDWTDAMEIAAVVGAFPAPMSSGYDGEVWPVSIECLDVEKACNLVNEQLKAAGIETETSSAGLKTSDQALRFVVGTWGELKADTEAALLDSGPAVSGVFARFRKGARGDDLIGLNQEAAEARNFGPAAGLIAASRRKDGPPVWFVTGGSPAGVEAAASGLTRDDLERRYSAVVNEGQIASLPLP